MAVSDTLRNYTGKDFILLPLAPTTDPANRGVLLKSLGHAKVERVAKRGYLHSAKSDLGHSLFFEITAAWEDSYIDVPDREDGVLFVVPERMCRLMPDRDDFIYISMLDIVGFGEERLRRVRSFSSCSMSAALGIVLEDQGIPFW